MLQNQLKSKLPEGWENQFNHHDSYPEDYYDVAQFNIDGTNKILVLNRNTMDLMEYYYDDIPDDQWIDLEKFFKIRENFLKLEVNLKDRYYINKNYEIFNKKSNRSRKLKSFIGIRSEYPRLTITLDSIRRNSMIHIIIASIFIPNIDPEKNIIINHKDCNKSNFSKENLEWCTFSYNSKSENKNTLGYTTIYYLMDNDKIINSWKGVASLKKDIPDFRKYLNSKRLYKEKYSLISKRLSDNILENYKLKHPVVEGGWYTNKFITSYRVEANLCGILRVNGKETIGSLRESKLVYTIKLQNNVYYTHRLIYETISGKRIDPGKFIDHIQPIRSIETINNEFFNLREVTPKENSNNEETLKLISNSCKCYDLTGKFVKRFNSISSIEGFSSGGISETINGNHLTLKNHLWCKEGEEDKIKEDIKYIYYRFNKEGIIEKSSSLLFNITTNLLLSENKRKNDYIIKCLKEKYVNTGMPAPDGYYYQQGDPDNMIYDPDNISYVKKREIIKWKSKKN